MKILAITHQLDFSGAPIALMECLINLQLLGNEINVVSIKEDEGLGSILTENKIKLISGNVNLDQYDLIIFNTLLSVKFIPKHKLIKTKIIAWIHEGPYLAGIAWSYETEIENLKWVDAIIVPSHESKKEWGNFINVDKIFCIYSPITIPKEFINSTAVSSGPKKICIVDPRESYRGIERIEKFLINCDDNVEAYFVGAEKNIDNIKYHRKNNYYLGRTTRLNTLQAIAACDIYLSATCMATQNRGLCEAILLNKEIYLSSIGVHREIGDLVGINESHYFKPLIEIELNFNQKSNSNLYKNLEEFSHDTFIIKFSSVLDYLFKC